MKVAMKIACWLSNEVVGVWVVFNLKFPSLWKGSFFCAFHSMFIVEFSWPSFEVKMGFICRFSKYGR